MTKKLKIVSILSSIGLIGFIITCVSLSANNEAIYNKVEIQGSLLEYDYKNLKDEADIIALVECKDNINKKNSTLYLDENLVVGFSSKRKVDVLKTYKGIKTNCLEILEPAALTKENELLCIEEYDTMKKGEKYIVFLSNDTLSGSYSLISGNNGKISIDNMDDNEYFDIAFKSIIDLESDIDANEKRDIISSTVINDEKIEKDETIKISNNKTYLNMNLDFKEKNGTIYAEAN